MFHHRWLNPHVSFFDPWFAGMYWLNQHVCSWFNSTDWVGAKFAGTSAAKY
jgi:hypothetical protein